MEYYEKTIKEKEIYKGKVISLKVAEVQVPNNIKSLRELVYHPGGVGILAYLDSDTIILVRQFRKPFEKILLEIPAGKLEKGEDPEDCGKRELEEETGYKAKNFTYLGKIVSSPGFCNEVIHLYKATGLYMGKIGGDEDEFISIHKIKKEKVLKMIKDGEIFDAKTISAFMFE
ncbi:MAG: NUDIX hydrolase [Bacillota bacterium]|nr:NUDIX hydrolase [Bacillota bacterium]